MFCPHCGAQVNEGVRFCSSCGKPIETKSSRGGSWRYFWLKLLAAFAVLLLCFYGAAYFFTTDLDEVVEKQLLDIRANKLSEAFYDFTSKEFQASNSFEKFKDFVRSSPILQVFHTINLGNITFEDDVATIKAVIQTGGDTDGEILYKLVKEGRQWKIAGMQLTEYQKVGSASSNATVDLIAPVKTQLKALHDKDILGAYKDLVTKDFETHFPFEKFKAFVLQNPILTSYHQYDYKEHYTNEDKGIVTVILNPDHEAVLINYAMVKEDGKWKIQQMRILTPVAKDSQDSLKMIAVVREQIEALQNKKVDEAYSKYIAKALQKETSLNDFRNYIKNYPAFTDHRRINITDPYIENGIGRLVVELENEKGITVVEYAVAQEEGQWKIVGMHVDKTPEATAAPGEGNIKSFKTRDLLNVIQGFLAALRDRDLTKAYSQYTSKYFQDENSLTAFEEFLKKHPELVKNNSSSFEKLLFNNNIATFGGTITTLEGVTLPVEFDLIQEDNQWKILHIFTRPAQTEATQTPTAASKETLELTKVVLGTKVDAEGVILDPVTTFKTTSGDIYANLMISHGKAGQTVEILLRHVESGSTIPKVTANVLRDGDSVINVIFSPPPKGWPKGSYQIRSSTDGRELKTYSFIVE